MNVSPPLCLLLALALARALPAAPAGGEGWDPFPELREGRRAAVAPGLEAPGLESCLGSLSSAAGAGYFAALVRVTDPGGSPSRSHADAEAFAQTLYLDWASAGSLDPETHLLLVAGASNRSLAVHPGGRWADLGLRGPALAELARESGAHALLEEEAWGAALCALARAVDRELERLRAAAPVRLEEVAAGLRELAEAPLLDPGSELRRRLERLSEAAPAMAAAVRRKVRLGREEMAAARSAWERGRPAVAASALAAATAYFRQAEEGLAEVDRQRQLLQAFELTLREERQSLERQPKLAGGELAEIQEEIERCRGEWQKAEEVLRQGALEALSPDGLVPLERCLAAVESRLSEAEVAYRLERVVLPRIVLAMVAALALLGGLARLRRWRRATGRLEEELDHWRESLVEIGRQSERVTADQPLALAAGRGTFRGRSRELEEQTMVSRQRFRLLWREASSRLAAAEEGAAAGRPWSLTPLEEAWASLRQGSLRPTPEERAAAGGSDRSPGLLRALAEASKERRDLLLEMGKARDGGIEAAREARELVGETLEALRARGARAMPIQHLSEPLEALLARREEAEDLCRSDPVAARHELLELGCELAELRDRARSGNALVERLEGPIRERIEKLAADSEGLRGAGYPLREPGFDADTRLARLRRQAALAAAALEQGQEEHAQALVENLVAAMAELAELLRASADARDLVPEALEGLERRRAELAGRLPRAEAALARAEERFDRSLFRDRKEGLRRLASELESLEEWLAEARRAHGREHYLSALAELDACDELLLRALRLLEEVEDLERRWSAAKKASLAISRRTEELLVESGKAAGEEVRGVGADLRGEAADLERRAGTLLAAQEHPSPDWLSLEGAFTVLNFELEAFLAELRSEQAAHRECQEEARLLGQELSRLGAERAQEGVGEPHHTAALEEAREQLAAWREELAEPLTSGRELRLRGEAVAGTLAWAAEVCSGDEPAVDLVELELRAADAHARARHGERFGKDLRVDCAEANRVLKEAREQARLGRWPEALALARRSRVLVLHEVSRCRIRARQRQQAERRRLAGEREAARQESRRRADLGSSETRSWVSRQSSRSLSPLTSAASPFGRHGAASLLDR